jgi:ribonuclease HI
VIRNHRDICLAACNELLLEVATPELAEALAARRALSFASDEGFDQVVLASDCLSMVLHIKSTAMDRSYMGVVIQDIQKMALSFYSISFCHVPRSLNESAHILARRAELYDFIFFKHVIPNCIWETLCNYYV